MFFSAKSTTSVIMMFSSLAVSNAVPGRPRDSHMRGLRTSTQGNRNLAGKKTKSSYVTEPFLYTDAPIEPIDGTIITNITDTSLYDMDWIPFANEPTGNNQSAAYEAISASLTQDETFDVRSVYFGHLADADRYATELDDNQKMAGLMTAVAQQQCNSTCFNIVLSQIQSEITTLDALNTYVNSFNYMQNQIAANLQSFLSAANAAISIDPTAPLTPPAHPDSSLAWLGIILDVLGLVSSIAAPLGLPKAMLSLLALTGATGRVVKDVVSSGGTSTSTANIDFHKNDALTLQYSDLVTSTVNTYDNMKLVVANQAQAICGNFGKLNAFWRFVVPSNPSPNQAQVSQYMAAFDPFFEFTAYTWLFPSKYQLCNEINFMTGSPGCSGDYIQNGVLAQYNNVAGTACEMELGTTSCNSDVPAMCQVYAKTWVCLKSDPHSEPAPASYQKINQNTYAISNGLITYNGNTADFLQSASMQCFMSQDASAKCIGAGMTFDVENLPCCSYSSDYWSGIQHFTNQCHTNEQTAPSCS